MVSVFDAVVSPQVSAGLMFRLMVLIMMKPRSKTAGLLCSSGPRALPRPANQHIHHERRKPAWQTPTHLRSIPSLRCWITHREWRRRTHQTCKSATEKYPVQWSLPPVLRWLLDIQREDNNKTTERSLCFHKAEICSTHLRNNVSFMRPTFWNNILYRVVLTNQYHLSAGSMNHY